MNMKRLFLLLVLVLFLPGCMGGASKILNSHRELMGQLPDNEFKKFEYHRNGVYSSANIVAIGGKKEDKTLVIDSINVNLNYGPESLVISLEGYERVIVSGDIGEE